MPLERAVHYEFGQVVDMGRSVRLFDYVEKKQV